MSSYSSGNCSEVIILGVSVWDWGCPVSPGVSVQGFDGKLKRGPHMMTTAACTMQWSTDDYSRETFS